MAEMNPKEEFDNTCRYVREVNGKWEYGTVEREHGYGNKRIKQGVENTMEAALITNHMSLTSVPHSPYGGPGCSGKY